jgi:hypothetical protein|nr:MAG TPA: hypothetical protein [Caudoviricetes sp.]
MKQFIVLTGIKGSLIAIRPSSIIRIIECKGENPKIVVETTTNEWYISSEKHSVYSIVKEIEE